MTDNAVVVQNTSVAKPTREFSTLECVFAWISLVVGYLFCRAFPVSNHSLGGFLFVFVLFVASAVILYTKVGSLKVFPSLVAVSAILISASLVISANSFIHFFAYSYALAAYCYFIYSATGNVIEKDFSDFILIDFFKALFVMPFYSFGNMFKAMFSGKAKKSGRFIAKLFLGLFIAIIPTTIVLLLLSYDRDFGKLLEKIFDFNILDVFSHLFSIGFGIPIGMFVFGLFISSVDKKCEKSFTVEGCNKASKIIKIVPVVTSISAILPILFLYVIFFISQWKYYVSGFTGVLPEDFSYAEYAREGFFQLCMVSFINLAIIISISLFMKRKSNVALKAISITFSVATLVLISTAIAKMVMYIDYYGLTQKRVYSTWLMVVFAIVFVLIIVRQFVPKLKIVAVSLAVTVVMFAGLSLSNVDGIIAKYNVDRYISGSLDTVDVSALNELGDSAIPQMVRLAESMKEDKNVKFEQETYMKLMSILQTKSYRYIDVKEKDIFSYNLPYLAAQKAIKNTNLEVTVTEPN